MGDIFQLHVSLHGSLLFPFSSLFDYPISPRWLINWSEGKKRGILNILADETRARC